jgi:hypothetical protein
LHYPAEANKLSVVDAAGTSSRCEKATPSRGGCAKPRTSQREPAAEQEESGRTYLIASSLTE